MDMCKTERNGTSWCFGKVVVLAISFALAAQPPAGSQGTAEKLSKPDSKASSKKTKVKDEDKYSIVGTWEGTLCTNAQILPVVFRFKRAGDGYSGSLDSPAQKLFGLAFDEISQEADGRVRALAFKLNGRFEGIVELNRTALSGTWSQRGMRVPLRLVPSTTSSKSGSGKKSK